MTTQFQPTPQHMVQDVKNIIEGYRMGALRALAQDPVQNSLDARIGSSVVKVEYQLHIRDSRHGAPVYLLTVTDTGTSGLSGEIMTLAELQRRRYRLDESQRWAAFEAHGFTKTGDHNIGSRGQGKSAFLYQSNVPPPAGDPEEERMLMLYDTLLPDGEYRLGVRFASPADVVRNPLIGRSAREAISSDFFKIDETIDPELEVPMGFEPLEDVGTRVIVPFISGETVEAIVDGNLSKWIERCWWRPIQKGELEVSIRLPNGRINETGVPEWWEGEPWSDMKQSGVAEYRDLPIGENNGYEIERLVLLHRDDLEEPEELHSTIPEYSGIQLLRHGQWVETLGAKGEFPDIVPFAHRGQFRGFAEFSDALNRRLRSIEKPQHDSFDGRYYEVKQIRSRIDEYVRDFARQQGWPIADETVQDAADIPDTDLMSNIIASFISPGRESLNVASGETGANSTDDAPPTWELDFSLHYPEGGPRVDWGQQITGIIAKCSHQPKNLDLSMNVRLQIKSETGRYRTLQQKFATSSRGEATLLFDDLEIVPSKLRAATSSSIVECPTPGKYTLQLTVISNGNLVASKSMPIFVEQDLPKPPERNKQSIGIRIVNETTGDDLSLSPRRINDGDVLEITVLGTNLDYRDIYCALNTSIRPFVADAGSDYLLADEIDHTLPAALPGMPAERRQLFREKVQIWTASPRAGDDLRHVVLSPGRHRVSADLYVVASDDPPVHASRNIYVEVDPKNAKGSAMPFRFQPVDGAVSPLCEIKEEPAESNEWVLYYNRTNVLYEQTVGLRGNMAAKMAFYSHVCIEALLDWALLPYLERRDDSNLEELRKSGRSIGDGELRDRYDDRIQHAIGLCGFDTNQEEFAIEMNRCRREMSGIMSSVLRQRMQ